MIRTQIYLDASQKKELEQWASERNQPMAELIREAVASYLVQRTPPLTTAIRASSGVWSTRDEALLQRQVVEMREETNARFERDTE